MRRPNIRASYHIPLIKKLSHDHSISEIAKITGLHRSVVSREQNNPANGIDNPKRVRDVRNFNLYRINKQPVPVGCFDVDQYAREVATI